MPAMSTRGAFATNAWTMPTNASGCESIVAAIMMQYSPKSRARNTVRMAIATPRLSGRCGSTREEFRQYSGIFVRTTARLRDGTRSALGEAYDHRADRALDLHRIFETIAALYSPSIVTTTVRSRGRTSHSI